MTPGNSVSMETKGYRSMRRRIRSNSGSMLFDQTERTTIGFAAGDGGGIGGGGDPSVNILPTIGKGRGVIFLGFVEVGCRVGFLYSLFLN